MWRRCFTCACKVSSHHAIDITDHAVAIHLYRIVQEAVNNAVQHGKAQKITITLSVRREGGMILMVHDNGVGLPTDVAERRGMGLRIMHHRARMIGATLEVQRGARGGTCVSCARWLIRRSVLGGPGAVWYPRAEQRRGAGVPAQPGH